MKKQTKKLKTQEIFKNFENEYVEFFSDIIKSHIETFKLFNMVLKPENVKKEYDMKYLVFSENKYEKSSDDFNIYITRGNQIPNNAFACIRLEEFSRYVKEKFKSDFVTKNENGENNG